MLKLVNNGPSPFGRKVMVALHEKALPFEIEWDVPWHKETIVDSYNPLEQLPILISEDGEKVYESSYILEWLDTRFPEPALIPSDPELRLAMGHFRVLAVGVMEALVRANFELARPQAQQSSAWVDRQLRKVNGGLKALNSLIGDRDYVLGDNFTLGDIEVGCVLAHLDFIAESVPPLQAFFARYVPWRKDCPQLSRYTDQISARRSFVESSPFMVNIDFASVVA